MMKSSTLFMLYLPWSYYQISFIPISFMSPEIFWATCFFSNFYLILSIFLFLYFLPLCSSFIHSPTTPNSLSLILITYFSNFFCLHSYTIFHINHFCPCFMYQQRQILQISFLMKHTCHSHLLSWFNMNCLQLFLSPLYYSSSIYGTLLSSKILVTIFVKSLLFSLSSNPIPMLFFLTPYPQPTQHTFQAQIAFPCHMNSSLKYPSIFPPQTNSFDIA